MSKINEITEQRIKDAAHIEDILTDALGVELTHDGVNLQGLCPFHADKHLGSFKVSTSKNICTCFSCGKTWNPINALMEGKQMDYPTALRYIAAMYGIVVDDEPVPTVKRAQIRPKAPELPMIYWPIDIVKSSLHHDEQNNLLTYLLNLPLGSIDKQRLLYMKELYLVGTSTKGWTQGFTIWWQVDEHRRVRTGKIMAYRPDGHRDKERTPSFTWTHSLMAKAGQWNPETHRTDTCLFGQHLIDIFPKATICLVESEKSALICSAFTDPNEQLWLATAGKSGLSTKKLKPLINRRRKIVIYPDIDGYDEWKAIVEMIGYNRIEVNDQIKDMWEPTDGPKADIADIMIRRQYERASVMSSKDTDYDKAHKILNLKEYHQPLSTLIDNLNLKLID